MHVLLTANEKKVARLLAQGCKDVEIAQELYISQRRVGEIIFNIKRKWGVDSRVQVGIIAYQFKLVETPLKELKVMEGNI